VNRVERPALAAAVDAVLVVVFVAIGRGSHDEGSAVGGTARVSAPFLIALALAWLLARNRWDRSARVPFGVHVWGVTVVVGMLVRRTAFDRGTAPSFVVVTAIVLGVFLLGWRALATRLLARGGVSAR
jgi:hypothetical protein